MPLRWLGIGIIVLILLHLLGQFVIRIIGTDSVFIDELVWRFNVDLELNVPTWYSSFLAAIASLLALFIALQSRMRINNNWIYRTWMLVVLTLLAVSINEAASFHELILQNVHILAGFGEGQSYTQNAWLLLLPFIVAAGAAAIYMMTKHVPKDTAFHFIRAAAVYLLGALVVEYVSIPVSGADNVYTFLLTPLEEGLEMFGMWLMLHAMVVHIQNHMPSTDKKLKALWR